MKIIAGLFLSLWAALLSAQPLSQPSSQPSAKHERNWVVAPVPAVVASSDAGYGGGILVDFYDHRKPIKPYQAMYEIIITATSKRQQSYQISLDRPQILGGDYRIKARLYYERTPQMQYFGVGNSTTRDLALEEEDFYEYDRGELSAEASLQRRFLPKWSVFGKAISKYFMLQAAPESLFAQDQPLGEEGGRFLEWGAGLLRDDRDKELWPTSGGYDELSLRTSPAPFNRTSYVGLNATLRRYLPLSKSVVLGGRAAVDLLFGDAPFYAQERFGLEGPTSIGGGSSLRGLPRARFIGDQKILLNAELRALPFSAKLFGLHLDFGAAAFVDAGKVIDDGSQTLHVGQGVGLRLLYEKDFVVRFDFARSNEDALRVYLDVGHPF